MNWNKAIIYFYANFMMERVRGDGESVSRWFKKRFLSSRTHMRSLPQPPLWEIPTSALSNILSSFFSFFHFLFIFCDHHLWFYDKYQRCGGDAEKGRQKVIYKHFSDAAKCSGGFPIAQITRSVRHKAQRTLSTFWLFSSCLLCPLLIAFPICNICNLISSFVYSLQHKVVVSIVPSECWTFSIENGKSRGVEE